MVTTITTQGGDDDCPPILPDGMKMQNCRFPCTDGMILAGQKWSFVRGAPAESTPQLPSLRILCLHGYLDNCRSFAALAPRLLQGLSIRHWYKSIELVAVDFPGHGQSTHKSKDHPPYLVLSDFAMYVAEIIQCLQWSSLYLIGHSMGATTALLYTAAFPEHIQQLILLDWPGPEFEPPTVVVERMQQHVLQRYSGNLEKRQRRTYKTLDDAIHVRQQAAVNSPGGNQWLSYEAAKEMVEWALEEEPTSGGFQFRHDPRLHWPALQTPTLEQILEFCTLRVPTLWLRARDGWPFPSQSILEQTESYFEGIQTLEGSHHFHADPETVDTVVASILERLVLK